MVLSMHSTAFFLATIHSAQARYLSNKFCELRKTSPGAINTGALHFGIEVAHLKLSDRTDVCGSGVL